MDQEATSQKRHPAAAARTVIFSKYEMGRLLGRGTFAKVYVAKNLETSQNVAVKVISKDLACRHGLIDQIQREIAVMRLVRHPNIVAIKEVMATRQRIFVVMEYVTGGELFAKVARGKLKEEPSRKFFQQLISAVDYCHSRGVSHRDLKPENLLLDEDGNLKVSDFGLSALPEQHWNDGLLHTRCGTPAYVAPEVLRRKGYDGAMADLWSCGVILYVLLAGFLPFQDPNVMKMCAKIFKADFRIPRWVSPQASQLISMLLVADPGKRISIPGILQMPWFCEGLRRPVPVLTQESDQEDQILDFVNTKSDPPFYNAFEFITAMSSGFDLSSLFETRLKSGSLFTSRSSGSAIMAKLEWLARKMSFKVVSNKDYKLRMEGAAEGRKGRLAVTAEVYEVAPELAVVEFSKSGGDTLEYRKFCEEDVRPALKDIVWSWQGETGDSQA